MSTDNLLFAKTHEWVKVEESDGAKVATVGISAHAIEALNDLVYLELPEVGKEVIAGESFGEIESVKAVSDIYAPVTGEVIEANSALPDNLDSLHEDAYVNGWIAKIKISDDSALADLMDKAGYEKMCAEEG